MKLFLCRFFSMVLVILFMFDCSGSRFVGRWLCVILWWKNFIR